MFDHVVFGASDYEASKAFFLRALAPLGVAAASEGPLGIELCRPNDEASLCIRRGRTQRLFTWHSKPRVANKSKRSIARLLWRAAKTTARLVCARSITTTTTPRLSLVRTATTSKQSAMRLQRSESRRSASGCCPPRLCFASDA